MRDGQTTGEKYRQQDEQQKDGLRDKQMVQRTKRRKWTDQETDTLTD